MTDLRGVVVSSMSSECHRGQHLELDVQVNLVVCLLAIVQNDLKYLTETQDALLLSLLLGITSVQIKVGDSYFVYKLFHYWL